MLEARMVRRTNLEVADIIEAFVEGTGRDWDWDDFCSLKIENRTRCNSIEVHQPLFFASAPNEAPILH
jgi:hypothetical protein